MTAWLAVLLVGIVLAAAIGIVPLRRYADRQWAEHVRRQRIMTLPEVQQIKANFIQFQIVLRDSFAPAMEKAVAALAEFGKALDALPRPTWRQRIARRVRAWFA